MTGRKGSFSVAVGGVGMWVTGCSFGAVGNAVCRTWESRTLAFPCAVNGVSHVVSHKDKETEPYRG